MKMLEIIEQDRAVDSGGFSEAELTRITNVFNGDYVIESVAMKEVVMGDRVGGDKFDRVEQSVIATRGSFAHGVIQVREQRGDETASAFEAVEEALHGDAASSLSGDQRKEASELLTELVKQSAKPDSSRTVLKSVGGALWGIIDHAEPLSKACVVAWPWIEKLWS